MFASEKVVFMRGSCLICCGRGHTCIATEGVVALEKERPVCVREVGCTHHGAWQQQVAAWTAPLRRVWRAAVWVHLRSRAWFVLRGRTCVRGRVGRDRRVYGSGALPFGFACARQRGGGDCGGDGGDAGGVCRVSVHLRSPRARLALVPRERRLPRALGVFGQRPQRLGDKDMGRLTWGGSVGGGEQGSRYSH